jgi:hypothetical protein
MAMAVGIRSKQSFFEKRTKKLLSVSIRDSPTKVFASFFKKKRLPKT